jgi:uncharacterized pyridoxamine 5'-phosphate oxidase family protein
MTATFRLTDCVAGVRVAITSTNEDFNPNTRSGVVTYVGETRLYIRCDNGEPYAVAPINKSGVTVELAA